MTKSNFGEKSIFQKSICPSDQALLAYNENTLDIAEKRSIELHLIDCEICNDTVDGLQKITQQKATEIIGDLNKKIDIAIQTVSKKNTISINWYYKVAAIFVLVLSSFLFKNYFQKTQTSQLADLKPKIEKQNLEYKRKITQEKINIEATSELEPTTNLQNSKEEKIDIGAQTKKLNDLDGSSIKSISTTETENLNNTKEEKNKSDYEHSAAAETTNAASELNESSNTIDYASVAKDETEAPSTNRASGELKKQDVLTEDRVSSSAPIIVESAKETTTINYKSKENFSVLQKEFQLNNYKKVLTLANDLLLKNADHCEALYYRGCSYSFLEKLIEAEKDFDKLLQLNCNQFTESAKIDMALIYVITNRKEIAKILLQQAVLSVYPEISERAKIEIKKF
jgi:Flp pilus assembly protein TadD